MSGPSSILGAPTIYKKAGNNPVFLYVLRAIKKDEPLQGFGAALCNYVSSPGGSGGWGGLGGVGGAGGESGLSCPSPSGEGECPSYVPKQSGLVRQSFFCWNQIRFSCQ